MLFKPICYNPKARYFDIILRFDNWTGDVSVIPYAMFEEGIQMANYTIREYTELFGRLKALQMKKAAEFQKTKQESEKKEECQKPA